MTNGANARAPGFGRRKALGAVAAAVLLPAIAGLAQSGELVPTPSQPEGPFYPKTLPADRDGDLTEVAGRPTRASGTMLYLSGTVLRSDARPVANASVELWQCDAYGGAITTPAMTDFRATTTFRVTASS